MLCLQTYVQSLTLADHEPNELELAVQQAARRAGWQDELEERATKIVVEHPVSHRADASTCVGVASSADGIAVTESAGTLAVLRQTFMLSPGGESNNDSCYSSDSSPSASRRNSSQHQDQHSDVSRTASDTLAAEHSDDPPLVQPHTSIVNNQNTDTVKCEDTDGEVVISKCSTQQVVNNSNKTEYSSKVEFALKLGYTEEQVATAFKKLSQTASQNELLTELIKVGGKGDLSEDEDDDLSWAEDEPFTQAMTVCHDEPTDRLEEKCSTSTIQPPPAASPDEPPSSLEDRSNLRPIVIDGSNVAMRLVTHKYSFSSYPHVHSQF